ncbi:MAG: hypothetical protein MR601_04690 [Erysipelotrichaceae bacterium]|nr:hypothetical protein [Erysipelotrichaceae bacterium]
MLKICKHDFKPHKFIECINDDCGNTYYLYQLQCMKCGKKPMFKFKKSREKLELFDFKMKQLVSRKNAGMPCILYDNYGLIRGQMLIVKEMAKETDDAIAARLSEIEKKKCRFGANAEELENEKKKLINALKDRGYEIVEF